MGDIFAGRYELVDPLGEGAAGAVWRVWDHRQGVYCAAKVLRQVDASSLLRFMREQSLRLEHPHILTPTGWAGEDDKVLFTMPIAAGGSVATLIGDFGPLPARLVAVLLDQLLAALEATHAQNVVHRDVKPANLLLDATGRGHPRLWLGDFGIAAGGDAPRLTQGPNSVGTPGYMAPEALELGWQPSPSTDVYAAGMCAVEMLTGVQPEPDAHVASMMAAADREEPVPAALIAVVSQLGEASLKQRYGHAAEARAELRETGLLESSDAAEVLGDVEVFDHTPSFPSGWGNNGPVEVEVPAQEPAPQRVAATPPPPPEPEGPQATHPEVAQRRGPSALGRSATIAATLMGLGVVLLALSLYVLLA